VKQFALAIVGLLFLFSMGTAVGRAQPMAPQYEECRLDYIFPNGGRRGTSVTVEFRGMGQGLSGAKEIIIDGPPGISVAGLKEIKGNIVQASLTIAADAPPGRRWLRVLSERSGLTNFAYFVVGDLPEHREVEPNQDVTSAQVIADERGVINGQIEKPADQDVFRIRGRAGEKFVAAIAAHALDVHGQRKDYGIADFNLELLTASGQIIAAAEDTIGFDPLIETTLPADGDYLLRVQLLNFGGFPEAVYRLTFGEVAYPIAAFPPGLAAKGETEVELIGPNVPPGKRWKFPASGEFAQQFVIAQDSVSGLDVPAVASELREQIEAEPNDDRTKANPLAGGTTVNGRFETAGDADWFRITIAAGDTLWLETHAHRYLRSPVDTLLQVFDSQGKLLTENDDEPFEPGYESYHDFKTTDSKLHFKPPAAGDYFVRVSEQTGLNGARAIYRLSVSPALPDIRLTHFPDAVPIWGPGSTAAVLVRIDRFAGCDDDVELSVEGLPAGWSSSGAISLGNHGIRTYSPYQLKVFLTITAPADGVPGSAVPFRIVGRTRRMGSGETIERVSQPLNLFYTSDTGFFRVSPQSRAAIAKPQGPWLESLTKEINLTPGGSGVIAVKIHNAGDLPNIPLVVNLATAGVACALDPPQKLSIQNGTAQVPLKLPPEMQPGTYSVVVAQSWRSDIRIGMPGPCTPLVKLVVSKP
jgi:hypothetical protein